MGAQAVWTSSQIYVDVFQQVILKFYSAQPPLVTEQLPRPRGPFY